MRWICKHNLIVHTQATNSNDGKALHKASTQAKQNLQLQKGDSLMILADKGYQTGAELQQCQDDNMITHVAYKEQPGVKHIAREFLAESFSYDKAADSYTCPAGVTCINPFIYFKNILERIAMHPVNKINELLPFN